MPPLMKQAHSKVSDIDHMAAEKESGLSQSASHLQFWGKDSKLIFRLVCDTMRTFLNSQIGEILLWTYKLSLPTGLF